MRFFLNTKFHLQCPLLSMPFFLLLWPGGIWGVLVLLLIMWWKFSDHHRQHYVEAVKLLWHSALHRYFFWVVLAYLAWAITDTLILKSSLNSIDNPVIFLLWCLTIPLIQRLIPQPVLLGYSFLLVLSFALVIALVQFHFFNLNRAFGLYGNGLTGSGAIKFGDMALMFGVMTLILLFDQKFKFLGLLGLLLGLLICAYASSRGGIFAMILALLVWRMIERDGSRVGMKTLGLLSIICLGVYGLNLLMGNSLLTRLLETKAEVENISAFKFSSPMGIRLNLWYLALIMFSENPWLGVGLNNFDNALKTLSQYNSVSDEALRYAHAHNEYLCALATGGIVGFIITILLFILPIRIFWQDYYESVWAKAGFWSVCLMSFFALTDCVFDRRMTVMAYIVLVSVCMAGVQEMKKLKNLC